MKAFISLLLGIFVYPWHNLPNTYEEIEAVGIDSMVSLRKKKKPLIRKDGDSLVTQFKQNSSYLKEFLTELQKRARLREDRHPLPGPGEGRVVERLQLADRDTGQKLGVELWVG